MSIRRGYNYFLKNPPFFVRNTVDPKNNHTFYQQTKILLTCFKTVKALGFGMELICPHCALTITDPTDSQYRVLDEHFMQINTLLII